MVWQLQNWLQSLALVLGGPGLHFITVEAENWNPDDGSKILMTGLAQQWQSGAVCMAGCPTESGCM